MDPEARIKLLGYKGSRRGGSPNENLSHMTSPPPVVVGFESFSPFLPKSPSIILRFDLDLLTAVCRSDAGIAFLSESLRAINEDFR